MKSLTSLLLLASAGWCLSGPLLAADLSDCQGTVAAGSVCLLPTKDLHPTQFAVGSVAVECKKQKIEKKHKKGKLDEYLEDADEQVPAVVGPDGKFYITDSHHQSTAMFRAQDGNWHGKDQKLRLNILENFHDRGISMADFWQRMAELHYVWPHDEQGKEVKNYGDKLPGMDMGDLKDDPYRTLSRWTRESCGYIKAGKGQCEEFQATKGASDASYFMEFYWAEFLRDQLQKTNSDLDTQEELMASYPAAIEATLNKEMTTKYFKDKGLDAVAYGQNQTGESLQLNFSKYPCESVDKD